MSLVENEILGLLRRSSRRNRPEKTVLWKFCEKLGEEVDSKRGGVSSLQLF
jgi:hypothetical protein